MADKNVQIKFNNGGSVDNIFPVTKMELVEGLPAVLDATNAQLADTVNIKQYGAKSQTGFDNSAALTNAMSTLQTGQTLIIPMGEFEYSNEWTINKSGISIIFYGSLKYTGAGVAVTQSGVDQVFHNPKISRDFPYNVGAVASEVLIGTAWRFYGVKKCKIFNPFFRGFKDGFLHDTSNGKSNAYIDIFTPKLAECFISYNRPIYSGLGWANEVNVFGGNIELGGFSDVVGSKAINIEAGDCHRFYSTCIEGVDLKIFCGGSDCVFTGMRGEYSNGVKDIEVTGKANEFSGWSHIWWQLKIVEAGQYNRFHFPQQNTQSIADKTLYLDQVNGNDANYGSTSGLAVKTCQRLNDLLPRQLDHNCVVNVAAGTYTDGFNIKDIRGQGTLTIQGDTADPTTRSVLYVALRNIRLSAPVIVKGLIARSHHATITNYANYYFEDVNVDTSYLHSTHSSSCGILAGTNANVKVTNSIISNKNQSMATTGVGADILATGNSGTGNTEAFLASCGTIVIGGTVPTATTQYNRNNGGLVISGSGSILVAAGATRPITGTYAGMTFFDTGLNKPVWRNAANTGWVDATGTTV